MLLDYLTDTPVAPLQRELVEIDDPLCGDVRNNSSSLLNNEIKKKLSVKEFYTNKKIVFKSTKAT